MSDTMRDRLSGDQGNSGKMSDENQSQNERYEGFEGMNYEQVRQPYNPQSRDGKRNSSESQSNSGQRENT